MKIKVEYMEGEWGGVLYARVLYGRYVRMCARVCVCIHIYRGVRDTQITLMEWCGNEEMLGWQ